MNNNKRISFVFKKKKKQTFEIFNYFLKVALNNVVLWLQFRLE
jgi:hypothetical protein